MVDITLWFTLGTVGMVIGTGLLAYGFLLVPEDRRRPFLLVVSVPAIAAVAYALMALGIGGITTAKDTTMYVPRYVDWLLTTPIHVVFVALLTGAATRCVYRVGILQAATIVLGAVGAFLAPPASYLFFLLGSAAFARVIYDFYTELEEAATRQSDGIEAMFRKLRSFVVVLWLVYPIIWLTGPAGIGLMDIETTSLVVAYIDVVAKVGFGLVALNDYVNLADLGAVDATIDDDTPSGDAATAD